jgi:ppGpp synthetase/RelA/SpoT-type nucleotidyltranferase
MSDTEESQLRTSYAQRLRILAQVCSEIEALLASMLRGFPRVDKIAGRPKPPDRFTEKAFRLDDKTGKRKYADPLKDIQDQVALRVVVYYRSDVQPVREAVLREFREIEDTAKEHPDPGMFGYEAHHFICMIPPEIIAKYQPPIDFFELQISTLFQHAWAEANHDLGYKPTTPLDFDQRRQIAWAAAQAWGADEIFLAQWKTCQSRSALTDNAN